MCAVHSSMSGVCVCVCVTVLLLSLEFHELTANGVWLCSMTSQFIGAVLVTKCCRY